MATKKRLADLVREEVNKQTDDDASSTPAAPKKQTPPKKQATAGRTTKRQSKSTTRKASTATKSNDESVSTLKTKLTRLEKDNKSLTADNAKLLKKVDLLEQKLASLVEAEKTLKSAQSKQKSMQLTLDEAKQDALKLAQENQKLLEKIKQLESSQSKSAEAANPSATRHVPAVRSPQPTAIQRSPRSQPVVYKPPAKKPFSRPIAPARMPSQRVVQNSDQFETWCYD